MGYERDAAIIARVVRSVDPAFVPVPELAVSAALNDMNSAAQGSDLDTFLLSAMRLLALAQNAHSRVIPNAAITVLPHRFVLRDGRLCAVQDGACVPVRAVNGVPVDALLSVWAPYLSGPAARQHVLAGLMLAWPAALALGQVTGPAFEYLLEDGSVLASSAAQRVPAASCFAENETGAVQAGSDAFPGPLIQRSDAGWHLRLADLKTLRDADVAQAVRSLGADPAGVVVDLRGNPGGSFLTALPLVQVLAQPGVSHRCAVLVNGYTFSAAIVVAALLAHRLGDRAALIGSEMGDTLAFWAEGDLLDLPQSGARLRYATAWHDWATGQPDPTTPPIIAQHLVAAGHLAVRPCPEVLQMQAARAFVLGG